MDSTAQTVDAVINIEYQGSAAESAWVLPRQSAPTSLEVAPAFSCSSGSGPAARVNPVAE